ncbi:hypothetical protein BaRGS_00029808 [Batillaria attramentaria]|uniref:Uncharacterized protein n=1 Tax=Batillaria attramentaria TaxID=370345 RepID=A0ABD0JV22_9CAEN
MQEAVASSGRFLPYPKLSTRGTFLPYPKLSTRGTFLPYPKLSTRGTFLPYPKLSTRGTFLPYPKLSTRGTFLPYPKLSTRGTFAFKRVAVYGNHDTQTVAHDLRGDSSGAFSVGGSYPDTCRQGPGQDERYQEVPLHHLITFTITALDS